MDRRFVTGFFDELTKLARTRPRKPGIGTRVSKGVARAGWGAARAAAPFMLLAGVPTALLLERGMRGFGEGLSEAERKRLSHER